MAGWRAIWQVFWTAYNPQTIVSNELAADELKTPVFKKPAIGPARLKFGAGGRKRWPVGGTKA
jgi:hypothetical protein